MRREACDDSGEKWLENKPQSQLSLSRKRDLKEGTTVLWNECLQSLQKINPSKIQTFIK